MSRISLAATLIITLVASCAAGSVRAAGEEATVTPVSRAFEAGIEGLSGLLAQSEYEAVIAAGDELLRRVREAEPDGSFDEAKILDLQLNAYYRSGLIMDARGPAVAAAVLALKERLHGPDHPELANSLMHAGNLHSRRGELEAARAVYDRAIGILTAAGPAHDPHRAIVLSSAGIVYRRMGLNDRALAIYEDARSIQERVLGPEHPDLASTLNNLALLLGDRGDHNRAVELHERALAIREVHFGTDHEWVGESANNLSSQLGYLGRYEESLDFQERAVGIFRKRLGPDHQRTWWATLNLGIAYLELGDPRGALPVCRELLDKFVARYGRDHGDNCYVLDALASCHFKLGDHEQALSIYTESLRVAESAFGVDSYETADTQLQMGKCLAELGRLDEAVDRIRSSFAITEAETGPDSALLCSVLHELADLQLRRDEAEAALALAGRAVAIGRRELGGDHPLLAASLLLAGRAESDLEHPDRALAHALEAEEISRRHLQQTMRALSEARALDYAAARVEGLDLALSQLNDGEAGPRVARVWDAVIRSRSVVLDEYAARNRRLYRTDDPEAAALVDSSLALRQRLANLRLRGPGWEEVPVYQRMLQDTAAELGSVERQLSLSSVAIRRERAERGLGYEAVAAGLPEGSALVAYVRFSDREGVERYGAFVDAAAGGRPRFLALGPAVRMDAAIEAWRDQASLGAAWAGAGDEAVVASRGFVRVSADRDRQLDAYREAGRNLRRLVWDPLAGLDSASRVFIVPVSGLNLVNFASLTCDDGRFLLEVGPLFHLLGSERGLAAASPEPARCGLLLALGGPDYTAEAALPNAHVFRPLPYSGAEVERVSEVWSRVGGEVRVLLGADATEGAFKRGLAGADVLHLAGHGYFDPPPPDAAAGWDDPLVRSGLALTGAGQAAPGAAADDGYLTATEVAGLDLSGVRWAVLSACDTGLGDLDDRGEGVFGLRRAFALAGARTVIMSLWAVADESAADWMVSLYRARWQEGMDTAAAVRNAARNELERRRAAGLDTHPYYWAGFVATGDWR